MPVPGLSLLGLKRIRGFVSILRYINPTIIIIITRITAAMILPVKHMSSVTQVKQEMDYQDFKVCDIK